MKNNYNHGRLIFYSSVVTLSLGAGIALYATNSIDKPREVFSYEYERVEPIIINESDVLNADEPIYEAPEGYTLMIDDAGNYYCVKVKSNVNNKKKIKKYEK